MEKKPGLFIRSGREVELRVERQDISFHDLGGHKVRVRVTVRNTGAYRSLPTLLELQSAPLGVFVPWRPLDELLVLPLEPGEAREFSTDVMRPKPVPVGDFDRVPPMKLLTALSSPDQPAPRLRTGLNGLLAPDLWDLVGRDQPYWAGNINVFVRNLPVERHQAKALRVYAGLTNLAMFLVGGAGSGRNEAYAFELVGLAPDWKTALYDMTARMSLLVDASDAPIKESQWVEPELGMMMVVLAVHPPSDCQAGKLQVHVTRRSTRQTAIVEFDLDPKAQGPGCYSA